MNESAARDAYYAYGVDLIRTAGLLLRTTPSVIYRAAVLLQRFEESVDTHFRSRYMTVADTTAYRTALEANMARAQRRAGLTSSPHGSPQMTESTRDDLETPFPTAAEYLIPNHAQQEMRTGLVPLVDLRAPLDYCLHHLVDQEDIVYLSAACLLIATKMEDPAIRIRAVVNTCMRISERRAGISVNETQKPPPARYEDFKACVVDAEEVVLHQLGFQTFVESPYKYVLMYLNLLVEPTEAMPLEPPARATPRAASAALTQWMVKAVQLVSDFPRCRQLLHTDSDVLAIFAIQQTCPSDVALPAGWTAAFGVSEDALRTVSDVYAEYLARGLGGKRAATALADLRAQLAVAPYRSVRERDEYAARMEQLRELRRSGCGGVSHSSSPAPPLPSSHSPVGQTAASIEELRDIIGASFSPPLPTHIAGSRHDRENAHGSEKAVKRDRKEL